MWWLTGVLAYLAVGLIVMVCFEVKRRAWYIRHRVGYVEWKFWAIEFFGWPLCLGGKFFTWVSKSVAIRLNTYVERKLEPVHIEVELTRKGLSKYD